MYKMLFVAYLFVISSQIICSNPVLRSCSSNDDCHIGEFCYEKRLCQACFNCEKLFQKEPRGCARFKEECGDCLPGYMPDPHNEFYNGRKHCVPITDYQIETTTMDNTARKDGDTPPWYNIDFWAKVWIALPILVVLLIVIPVVWYFCCYRNTTCRYQSPEQANSLQEKPRLSVQPSAPLAPLLSNPAFDGHLQPINMCHLPPAYSPQVMPEAPQRARPYASPSAYISPPDVPVDNTDSAQPTDRNVEDEENTQPSSWTPTPASGERTSFEGILAENANRPLRRESSPRNTPEEPPSKQAKSENPVVNINVVTINSSFVQQSSQTNTFPTNMSSPNHREENSPTRSRIPDENQENDDIVPNGRNDTVNFVFRSNRNNNID